MSKTALLKLGAYYESFKNIAQLQGQLFNTATWTGHKRQEGNTDGWETNKKNPSTQLTYLALQRNNSFHSLLQALY